MTGAPLECRNLACGYPGREVLSEVSFTVQSGESIALLGVNGSGKSTFLLTLAKSLKPLRGEVLLQGASVSQLTYREAAKRVAFVPQEEPAAFPFPAHEVVAMGRLCHADGLFDSERDREVGHAAMERADCLHLRDRLVTTLSGGERQRVLIARALAQEAKLLLLDEPTSHLDVAHQLAVAAMARAHTAEGGAVIAAVHDLNLAATIADRGLVLHDGRIVLDGPIEKILKSPHLDKVYGVNFQRVDGPDGKLRVIPVGTR